MMKSQFSLFRYMNKMSIEEHKNKHAKNLSGGTKRKVTLKVLEISVAISMRWNQTKGNFEGS